MEITHTAATSIGAGVFIILIGIIWSLIFKKPSLFLFGWGCCDIFLGIYHRKEVFCRVRR